MAIPSANFQYHDYKRKRSTAITQERVRTFQFYLPERHIEIQLVHACSHLLFIECFENLVNVNNEMQVACLIKNYPCHSIWQSWQIISSCAFINNKSLLIVKYSGSVNQSTNSIHFTLIIMFSCAAFVTKVLVFLYSRYDIFTSTFREYQKRYMKLLVLCDYVR